MVIPENRLFCRLDGVTPQARTQHRLDVLTDLGLLEPDSAVAFEEAVQTAVQFIDLPIGILSIVEPERECIKSATGLSRLGVMNPLARERQWSIEDSFGVHVVDSQQVLVLRDATTHPAFAQSAMVQQYGIQAYLGAPLMTASGDCVGVLSVLSTQAYEFSQQDIEFLVLNARLAMSEYERQQLDRAQTEASQAELNSASLHSMEGRNAVSPPVSTPLKFELLAQLTQELRTPLTSVMGMASVLTREVYGPLTSKQKEYLDIIHHSGEYLLSLVQEVLELSSLDMSQQQLNLSSLDIEMLCQQAIGTLDQAASRRDQQIRLTVEPGNRIWYLDKEKMRQMLYHLIFSVVHSSAAGSIVRLHVSNKGSGLRLTVWTSHPHLGEGMPFGDSYLGSDYDDSYEMSGSGVAVLAPPKQVAAATVQKSDGYQKNLGLLLGRQIVELHGGQIQIQGSGVPGYRYVITLPRLMPPADTTMPQ
ncbi:GAF domain-containing sensor histidine kinase [filamentous cyanobacterium LEGE 11480]|uniref:histidine kinase n=1 Tax=Romeriopsis navalis LEGE 11480 TaxID=2777977 RepID=A0A928Z4J1_9CYAN|nr:GAF domain-containing sensor histidine kinase [Romeriopsis navalis]MBE9031082.1 GAF domain-containing sensor histidine kinase [Romeriopsis navalis LEGE 11480]